MAKKVVIIGCTGTLGQELVREFKNSGYQVIAWDKAEADVTSPLIANQLADVKPDIVINATAYNSVDKAETDPAEKQICRTLNSDVPGKLAQIAKELNSIFVHYSSNYVFSGDNKSGYTEDSVPDPVNVYGRSKLDGEEAVRKVNDKYYIIRLSRLFGIRGTSPGSKRTFVEIMRGELGKTELEVGNTEVSAVTYAPDLAKLTRQLIESKKPWGIYHGANSGFCTWAQWAMEIFKNLGSGPKVIPVDHSLTPKTTRHPEHAVLLNTKLPPQRSWQTALAEFLAYGK